VWTPLEAVRRPINSDRRHFGFSLAGESHGKVQYLSSALQFEWKAKCHVGVKRLVISKDVSLW
jgi:hypothetical protein